MNSLHILYSGLFSQALTHRIIQIFFTHLASSFLQELMILGFEYFFKYPESISLELNKGTFYLKKYLNKISVLNKPFLFRKMFYVNEQIFNLNSFCLYNSLSKNLYKTINPISNSLDFIIKSKAKATEVQAHQITGMRGYLSNIRNFNIPFSIVGNFTEGLNILEFLFSLYGTRKGILDTAIKTADTGYLTRRLVESVQDVIVKENNCGSTNLLKYLKSYNFVGSIKLVDEFLLKNKFLAFSTNTNTKIHTVHNFYISNKFLKQLNIQTQLLINTPITCISGRSICNRCMGSYFQLKSIPNESLGVLTGESIGEPSTQMTLRTFHTGGTTINSFKFKNSTKHINTSLYPKLKFNYVFWLGTKKLFKLKTKQVNFPINVVCLKYNLHNKHTYHLFNLLPYKFLQNSCKHSIIFFKTQIFLLKNTFSYNKYYNNIFKINSLYMQYKSILQLLIQNLNNEWILLNVNDSIGYSNFNIYKIIGNISFISKIQVSDTISFI